MPAVRYIDNVDVQGWEPAYHDAADADPSALGLPQTMNPSLSSRRQAPPTRARAATCPNIYDFTFMPRPGLGPLQQKGNTSVSAYGQATESYVSSSARNAAAAGRSGSRPRSSTERKIARKLAENANYVPRPKNSFILFRTEFVAQKTGGGAHSDASSLDSSNRSLKDNKNRDDEEDTNQSLSKQASEVWNKMTDDEKKPWVERAKLEKAAHEARYPHYRYKPIRQSSARKNFLPPGSRRAGESPSRRPSLDLEHTISELSPSQMTDARHVAMSPNGLDHQFDTGHQSSIATSSAMTLEETLQMPAPLRKLSLPPASPSSSALANALGSRPPTPTIQEQTRAPTTGPTLPSVPPVPALSLPRAGLSRTTGLLPIPRSPSAPIFDKHVVGHFPYQQQQQRQHFITPSPASSQTQNSYLSTFAPSFAASPTFTSSSPQMPVPAASAESTNGQGAISPLSSTSGTDATMQSALPTPGSTEADYIRDFVQRDSNNMTAGPTPISLSRPSQQLFTNDHEKRNDNCTYYEMDEMDIDMRALLNLSPLPEVAEPTITDVQRPFDAIAALWIQDQQRTNDNASEARAESELQAGQQSQILEQASPNAFDSVFAPPKNAIAPSREPGLDSYTLAVAGDYSDACATNTCLEDDLLRLDLDFEPTPRFGCAVASTLSLSAFDGPTDMLHDSGDVFGYDRERGLYGFGTSFGNELGIANGLDYGF